MKKKFLAIISMIIIIIGIISVTVYGADYKMNFSSKLNDKNVTVNLSVTNFGDGIDAIEGTLKYDTDKLEFVEIKRANSKWQEPSYSATTNKFTMLVSGESFKENSNIITITFKLKENIVGKANISLSDIKLADTNDQRIDIPNVSTYISIEGNLPDDNKNEINNSIINVVTNEVVNTTNNIIANTNTTTNVVNKDNTQANNKIPQTGDNNLYIYIGITICSVLILSSGIYFIRYKILSK